MGVISHLLIFIIKKIMIKRLGIRNKANILNQVSSLWNNLFGVWNADGTNTLSVKHAWNANGDAIDSKSGANGTIATPSGTSWVPSTMTYDSGKLGSGAFTFSGSNFISLPNGTLNFTDDFSVSAWIYVPTAFGTNISRIISCFDNQIGSTTYRGWELVYNNGTVKFQIYPSGADYYIISVPMTLKDQWVHVTAVRTLGQQGNIYINGVAGIKTVSSNGSATSASAIAYNGSNNLAYIGALYDFGLSPRYSVTPAGGFKIDAIQTFNGSALEQAAVTELYNSGNGQEYPFTLSNALIASPNDSIGSNDGTLMNGTSFTTGKIGKAFTFDGINDYVELPNNILKKTGDFSFSLWVNPSVLSGNRAILGTYYYDGTTYGWRLDFSNAGMYFRIFGSSQVNLGVAGTFNTGQWYHITVTRKASTGTKIYINGALNVSNTSTINPNYATTQYTTIGATQYQPTSITYYLNGKIDAVNVWDRELTPTEITELYNSGNGKQYPN